MENINEAVERLKLPRCVSMRQIQQRYRELVKAHHPDRHQGQHDPEIAAINAAYARLMDYCRNYQIPLDGEPPRETPRDWWKEQFGDSM
jgi:curved DNA-binding protein CbpA